MVGVSDILLIPGRTGSSPATSTELYSRGGDCHVVGGGPPSQAIHFESVCLHAQAETSSENSLCQSVCMLQPMEHEQSKIRGICDSGIPVIDCDVKHDSRLSLSKSASL